MSKYQVGDRVICNGYKGTVTAVTSYGMVEVRLASGCVCVDPDDDLTIRHA
jgi:preprotein translocase subunit YajC